MKQAHKKTGSFKQNFPANNKLSEKFSVVISLCVNTLLILEQKLIFFL